MSPRLTYAIFAVLAASVLLSCKKESHSSSGAPSLPFPVPPVVYVLGVENGSVVYWKDGKLNPVYSQSGVIYDFGTSSLAASGGNIYIAGFETANASPLFPYMPVFWLNGAATPLRDSTGSASNGLANSVAVAGSDVYVAGVRGYDSQVDEVPFSNDSAAYPITGSVATVWKNGTPVTLPGPGSVGLVDSGKYANRFVDDYVSGMFVSGSDVYVAGGTAYNVPAHARYWKNGTAVDLGAMLIYSGSGNSAGFPTTTGIYVAGSDVYVSGLQQSAGWRTMAIYWKNGTPVFLGTDSLNGSVANSIFVSGSDVYVAGWQNIGNYSRAMLWKNGTATPLTSDDVSSTAMAVTLSGKDVYVAGYSWVAPHNYVACFWKNGTRFNLTDASSSAIAYSIKVE